VIASRKQDSLLHEVIFKYKQDIAPRYTTDFQHTALLLEMLLIEEQITEVSLGFCATSRAWYVQIVFETEFEEIAIKKLEETKELALCSVSLAYFGGRSCKLK